MKSKYIILLLVFWNFIASAQLVTTPGSLFSVLSDTKLTLRNTDLINNGNLFLATTSPVSFTGDASSFIGGDQATRFFRVEINKTNNQSVVLRRVINVGSNIFFTSGFFNLNGFTVDLETTGSISGENKDSRFVGINGGQVIVTTTLNSPSNINPGNLGMEITSNQNLGQVTIKRGHQAQTGSGLSSSILRYFEISQVNNLAANATLRFHYFDEELNGTDENALSFFKSDNSIDWSNIGSSSKDKNANFVELAGTAPFSRFTLAAINAPLPVQFISFSINCNANGVALTWKTAQEVNSNYFNIQRSIDGINWTTIGKVSAAGNSSTGNTYGFTDNPISTNSYYRVVEFDVSGKSQYTNVLRSLCSTNETFTVWPNPVHEKVFINILSANPSQGLVKLFDDKGSVLKVAKANLAAGNNQLSLDLTALANGVFYLSAEWNNGTSIKTIKLVKR